MEAREASQPDAVPRPTGEPAYSTVPQALQPAFMTTQLSPHQKVALNENSYGRLQQLYPGGKVHDVSKSIIFLRENLVGFFIAMPLDWGMGTKIEGDPTKATILNMDIAKKDTPTAASGVAV